MKLKELEKRLKQEPDNLGLRVTVAGLLREAGRSVEAVELYRSVALAYRKQGRNHQAIAVCRSILEIAPADEACRALLATLSSPAPAPAPPEPPRRSSLEETPLPRAVPHHVADPTSAAPRVTPSSDPFVEGAPTRPGGEEPAETTGLAQAARRISGLIGGDDLAAELETRQRPRIDSELVRRISLPPPTVPVSRVTPLELTTDREDALTPVPRDSDDELTQPRDRLPDPDDD